MSERVRPITMPKWGLAMTEGLVTAWHLEEGAVLEKGTEALDIETEKITNEYPSPAGGVLRRKLVQVGETVPVGGLLGVVADADVPEEEIEAYVTQFNARFADTLAARAEVGDTGAEPETVEAGGRRMRYLRMGEDDAPALVLLHGFGGDLNNWLFNQPVLAERYQVLAVDLPGHGGSTRSVDECSVSALASAVGDLLDTLELPAVHLAGHSLGGAVATQLAVMRPPGVRSLSLIASAGLGPEINMGYIQGFIDATRRKDLKPVAQELFADPALVKRELLDDLLRFKRLDGVQALLQRLADTVFPGGTQALLLREALATVNIPMQVIWGAQDRIIPAAHAQGLREGVRVSVLEGAGHMVHMEKAAEVNALLGELLVT